jgi:hypothetical protein
MQPINIKSWLKNSKEKDLWICQDIEILKEVVTHQELDKNIVTTQVLDVISKMIRDSPEDLKIDTTINSRWRKLETLDMRINQRE